MGIYTATWSGVTTGTALHTMCQIATPATTRCEVIEWSVSFNGTSASALPLKVLLGRQTTAGTGTAFTSLQQDLGDPAGVVTVLTAHSAEPTAPATYIYSDYFTPVGLGPAWQYPLGRGIVLPVSARLGVVVDATGGAAVSCSGHITWNE
jgi:hypothetical protein